MATYYLDFEGGNDANDGTTFANRWKTINNGATAARIAPGDVIRMMKSPDPTSLGTTGAFTIKSPTVTLGSARNALITNCDSAWTASTNVTCTSDTSTYRTSTGSAKIEIASGFTTGLAAYFALGSAQNYSSYQGITLWLLVTGTTLAASTLSIRLCSDTAGVTTVDTLTLPAVTQTSQWIPVYIDKGSALGASIQSIALYADVDPGAINVFLDNISTTRAAGDDCLTLKNLIGKNTTDETWWALRSINGTTLTIDMFPNVTPSDLSFERGYYGVTETVTCYQRKTISLPLVSSVSTIVPELSFQDSGSVGSHIEYSGGWDTTNMSTRNGETWVDGQSGFGAAWYGGLRNYLTMKRVGAVRFYVGTTTPPVFSFEAVAFCHNSFRGFDSTSSLLTQLTTDAVHCHANGTVGVVCTGIVGTTFLKLFCYSNSGSFVSGTGAILTTQLAHCGELKFCNNTLYGWDTGNQSEWGGVIIDKLVTNDNGLETLARSGNATFPNDYVWNVYIKEWEASGNGDYGAIVESRWVNCRFGKITAQSNGAYGLYAHGGSGTIIEDLITSGNTVGAINSNASQGGHLIIMKSSLSESTKLNISSPGNQGRGRLTFHNFNGTAGDHRVYHAWNGTVFSESSVRHTASGLAWKMSPLTTTFITSEQRLTLVIARIAVVASQLVTASIWLRRTNTGLSGDLFCQGGQLAGLSTDLTAAITAAADTWEKVTVTGTPSESGVIEFSVRAYGGTTYSLYVDDFSVVQG